MDEKTNEQRFVGNGEYQFQYNGKTGEEAMAAAKRDVENDQVQAYSKYSPLGTIVSVDGSKKLMIIGYKYKQNGGEFDYIGCEFPFGVDQNHGMVFFNHQDIKSFYDIGFINEQGKYYRSQLDQAMPENNGPKY